MSPDEDDGNAGAAKLAIKLGLGKPECQAGKRNARPPKPSPITWLVNEVRENAMQTHPWHSIKQPHHHNNTACTEGNNIEPENYRTGTGGKPLCQHCARLNWQGR
jgi:hypothetical protein